MNAAVPPGFWRREASHYPRPLSPMFRMELRFVSEGLRHAFEEFGLLAETLELCEIGGWVYNRMVPLGGKDRKPPPSWLLWLAVRTVPMLRRRVTRSAAAIRSDKHGRLIERWYAEWEPGLWARIAQLRAVALAALSDEELDAHAAALVDFFAESNDIHFLLHGALCLVLGDLAFTCRDLLGWDDARTFALLNGLSAKSTEPSRRLAELACMARQRPAIRDLLEHTNEDTPARLAEVDPEFARAFAAYQHEFGCRALRYEVAEPTLEETPSLILGLIFDQVGRSYDPEQDDALLAEARGRVVAEARAALTGRPAVQRERFERALTRAERAYPVREDNEFFTISAPTALVRYTALELGRRLAERGQIRTRDDVFVLEMDEARAALRDRQDRRAMIEERKVDRAQAEANPGPPSYGDDPGPPPSMKALPAEARFAMEALVWVADRILATDHANRAQQSAATLRGIAAAPGRYTGPARVILGEDEFDKIEPGDVLVCPITSPVWSVLFPSVGALVTDTGGILSHPAIIAREYRIPAVVATGNATALLRDGQTVTVDGDAGEVLLG
jgi:phosphohistidine swiveling domain-containing protein